MAKNTSLPSLFDPLTLALSILILFFKKKKKLVPLDLNSIHLLLVFLKKSNLFVFYLFSFYLLYNKKKNLLRVF